MCSNQPLMGLRAYEVHRIRALAEEGVQLQQKVFQRWIQAKLQSETVSGPDDLITELKDGRLLMQLCVALCGASFIIPRTTSNRFQRVENISRVFFFLRQEFGADLSDIAAEDIVEGRVQPTLRVIWCIVLAHHSRFESTALKTKQLKSEKAIKADLLEWCRQRCRRYDVDVPNLGSSWRNGLAFMALLMDYLQEDERLLIARSIDSESPINVLAIAFEMAENKLRIPRLLDADEFVFVRHDEKSLMTYLLTLKQSIETQQGNYTDR